MEIAIRSRALEPALEMSMLLVELEPESTLGRDLVASLLAGRGDVAMARETLSAFQKSSPDKALIFTQLAYLFGKYTDKAAVLEATRALAAEFPGVPEARYAVGVAGLVAGQNDLAKAESLAVLCSSRAGSRGRSCTPRCCAGNLPRRRSPSTSPSSSAIRMPREVRLQLHCMPSPPTARSIFCPRRRDVKPIADR